MSQPGHKALGRRLLLLVLVVALIPAGCRAVQPPSTPGHPRLVHVSTAGDVGWGMLQLFAPLIAIVGGFMVGGTLDLLIALPIAIADGKQRAFLRWFFGGSPNPFATFWGWILAEPEPAKLWHETLPPRGCR